MSKKKSLRIIGFVGALCASGALIAAATNSTGAYFTDQSNGTIQASSGHLTLNTSDTTLSFANLMPGQNQTLNVDFNTGDSTASTDIWMTFPDDASYIAFSGASDQAGGGGLGRFGVFAVSENNNLKFRSHNLVGPPQSDLNGAQCGTSADGIGGSDQVATSATDTPPYCPVPRAIKLASNVPSGGAGEVEITFGLSGKWTAQNSTLHNVSYSIVATQVGVRPDAANF